MKYERQTNVQNKKCKVLIEQKKDLGTEKERIKRKPKKAGEERKKRERTDVSSGGFI